MNKYKKIAAIAVSVVMAGTMAASLVGCKDKKKSNLEEGLIPNVDSKNNLTYADNTELNTYLGYDKDTRGIKYTDKQINDLISYTGADSSSTVSIYGKQYVGGSLKPAWQALSEELKIKFNDDYDGSGTDKHMEQVTNSEKGLAGHQVFTASAANINSQGASGNLLNIAQYLDYMPNYKAFLDANPIVRLSLTADANGSMYMLPYFDGNDDIEKFVILRKDLVETLLNGKTGEDLDSTVTYAAQGTAKGLTTTSTVVESFMGKVEADNYTVDVTDPAALDSSATKLRGNDIHVLKKNADGSDNTNTVKLTVNYKAALDAAKNESTPLGAAVKAAAGKAYTTESGNIVDMQNFAINQTSGAVKGGALLTILREYIKVAYQDASGNPFYVGTGKALADVFNSAYAAWDVDLYTALGRCFVTCGSLMGDQVKDTKDLYLLTGREHKAQRFNDTVSMAGELYGIRGLESRYQYIYIKADGTLADARTDAKTYEALDKMNKLAKEGLFNAMGTTSNVSANWTTSAASNSNIQTLSLHDYVQTQTAKPGFAAEKSSVNPYNGAPILTPVSRWDTTGDGSKDTVMRFTESWRGVKNTGWCISKSGVKNNPDKLSAALKLVDYFFSNDGQILMTYGPQAAANDAATANAATLANGGFWYANKVTNAPAEATETLGGQLVVKDAYKSQYFTYKNEVYTGTYYNGRQIPTMTESSKAMFSGSLGGYSFTDYARYVIGSALNIGNKDQGFEYQCTAKCGIVGSEIVNIALVNGTIKHPIQQVPTVGTANATNWYTLAPSLLPYSSLVNTAITTAPYTLITGLGSTDAANIFSGSSSSGSTNLMIDICAFGLGSGAAIRSMTNDTLPADAAGCVTYVNNLGVGSANSVENMMSRFEGFMKDAWALAVSAYKK